MLADPLLRDTDETGNLGTVETLRLKLPDLLSSVPARVSKL